MVAGGRVWLLPLTPWALLRLLVHFPSTVQLLSITKNAPVTKVQPPSQFRTGQSVWDLSLSNETVKTL